MDERMLSQSSKYGMGTVITHKVFGEKAGEALSAAEAETERLEKLLSRYIQDSDISRINISSGLRSETVSEETFEVLSHAVEISQLCHGCFDVTVGPLTDLWRNAKQTSALPGSPEISRALTLVDFNDLLLDVNTHSAGLKKAGQSVDLGGIGKGYAADRVAGVMKKFGIVSAFTNFGGNVVAIGSKPDGSPWRVGIQHPRREDGVIGVISLTDKSVVTSGDYQRYFTGPDGKRYHHILDPLTGYPSESGLISVTVVTDSSIDADALSTALFVAGIKKGVNILRSFSGAEAIFVDAALSVYLTPGINDCFQMETGAFHVLDF